jgi:hypothetical protein
MRIRVYGGDEKVPTGTYTDHRHGSKRVDTSDLIRIEWIFSGSEDTEMYIDDAISSVSNSSAKKYAWLLESKKIIPSIYEDFYENIDSYMSMFDMAFTSDKKIYDAHERIHFVPANTLWVKDINIFNKTKLLSMIVSNNNLTVGHSNRLYTANRVRGIADIYGRGINPIESKEDGLRDYMFSIAMENGYYNSYYTEKILDCFATGTIPIYKGCSDIEKFFNPDGIIILTDDFDFSTLTKELYESKMEAVLDNFNRSKEYVVLEKFIENILGVA